MEKDVGELVWYLKYVPTAQVIPVNVWFDQKLFNFFQN